MKFFEKNIKDRFKNASSTEGIDADDLWNNIESSIASESPKRKVVFFRKGYWLILLSLILIGTAVVWNQTSDESSSSEEIINSDATAENQNIEEKDFNVEISNNDYPIKNNDAIEASEEKQTSLIQNENLKNTPPIILSKSKNENSFVPSTNNRKPLSPIEKNNDLLRNDNQEINSLKPTSVETQIQEELISVQKEVLKSEEFFNGLKIDFAKIKSIDLLLTQEEAEELGLNELIVLSKFKQKKSKFSLGIFTGVHTMKNKFSSTLTSDNDRKDLLNKGFDYELGYSFALEASFYFNKNIFITSGLEYVKSKSEFNWTQTRDTIIVNPSSHVGSLTDAFATRTVKHHNKIDYLSIPVSLGFQKSLGKIELGASAGVGFNFTKNQTGRALNFNNQIASYPSDENEILPVSKFFISYNFRPHLNYVLDEKISFQLRSDIRFQNLGESDFYQLKYNSIFYGLSAGAQFKF